MIYLPDQRLVDIKIYNETMPIRLLMTYYYFGIFRIVMDLDQVLKGWMVVGFVKYSFFCNKMSILRKTVFWEIKLFRKLNGEYPPKISVAVHDLHTHKMIKGH